MPFDVKIEHVVVFLIWKSPCFVRSHGDKVLGESTASSLLDFTALHLDGACNFTFFHCQETCNYNIRRMIAVIQFFNPWISKRLRYASL
jgi:hypothetical protein